MREMSFLEDYEIVDAALRDRLTVLQTVIGEMSGGGTGGGQDHTQVSYILTDGASYIDTGVYPNPYYTVEMSMELPELVTGSAVPLFGCYDEIAKYAAYFINVELGGYLYAVRSNSYDHSGTYSSGDYVQTNAVGVPHVYKLGRNMFTVDGQYVFGLSGTPSDATPFGKTLYLFTINNLGEVWSAIGKFKCYYVKIWDEEDVLVRDFIPVVKSDGTVCMYDNITNEYYYNLGSGTFKHIE